MVAGGWPGGGKSSWTYFVRALSLLCTVIYCLSHMLKLHKHMVSRLAEEAAPSVGRIQERVAALPPPGPLLAPSWPAPPQGSIFETGN